MRRKEDLMKAMEEDQKVLEKIFKDQPDLSANGIVHKITELLPLG